MSGKGPIIGVLGLGLVASLCAAVLMATLRGSGNKADAAPTTADVVVAIRELPPMTRIEKDLIEVRTVSLKERPEGGFSDPVQILGRVLKVGLVEGQAVTEDRLLNDEAGAKLASSLPEGLRAVSVELPSSSAMRGLLYPGCRVDVIVSYRNIPGSRSNSGPISRTLLQNVSVLAVEDKTVFTVEAAPDAEEEKSSRSSNRPARSLMVTLMVDPQQARELQAASDQGELSLSLRNPLDSSETDDPAEQEPAPLAQGQGLSPDGFAGQPGPVPGAASAGFLDGPWRTLVIRGGRTEIQTFNDPAEADEPAASPERVADVPTDPEIDG